MRKLRALWLIGFMFYVFGTNSNWNAAAQSSNPPDGAITITIVYPPEFDALMPIAISRFNDANRNPQGRRPSYVIGLSSSLNGEPFVRSSGRMMEEIVEYVQRGSINSEDPFYSVLAPELQYRPPTVWIPAVGHWLDLVNESTGQVVYDRANSPSIARTAVVYAIWKDRLDSFALALGKSSSEVTMEDLLNLLRNGWGAYDLDDDFGRSDVYYGRTNPFLSSTGLSASMLEVHTCVTNIGIASPNDSLDLILSYVNDPNVQQCLQAYRTAIVFNDVTTQFVEQIAAEGNHFVDFAPLSEDDFLRITAQVRQGTEVDPEPGNPLIALYPSEGTFWADYPFAVPINDVWVTPEQRQVAELFLQYLMSDEIQALVLENGFRPTTTSPNVTLTGSFFADTASTSEAPWNRYGVISEPSVRFFNSPDSGDLPSSAALSEVQLDWCDVRKRSYIYVVLDASQSMASQDRMGNALTAIEDFLTRVDSRDHVGLLVFSGRVSQQFSVPLAVATENNSRILDSISQIRPLITIGGELHPEIWGTTALYSAVLRALDELSQVQVDNVARSIILLSDGGDNASPEGTGLTVVQRIRAVSAGGNPINIFPIDYTNGNEVDPLLGVFAQESGTTLVSGAPESIVGLFSQIGDAFASSGRCPVFGSS